MTGRWRILSTSLLLMGVLVLGVISLSFAQGGGGSFVPSFSYIVSGQWTWTRTTNPWVIKPAGLAGQYAITFAYTTPTANRTITIPNKTGTLMVSTSANGAAVVSGIANVSGTSPYSVTTGLSSLTACSLSIVRSGAQTADNWTSILTEILTSTAGRLDIYRWRTTGAAATEGAQIAYLCTGT